MYAATTHAVEAARAEQVARLRRWWPRRRRVITPTEDVTPQRLRRVAPAGGDAARTAPSEDVVRAA